jgi:hypothetical protein
VFNARLFMRNGKRKIILSVAILLSVTCVLLIWYVYYKINSPSYGKISQAAVVSTNNSSLNLNPVYVKSNYVSYQYPALLARNKDSPLVYPMVEMFNYSYRDIQTWYLAIDILNITSGTISGNSAYDYRKLNPDKYSETTRVINGKPVVIFTDNTVGGFSKLAILVNGSYQATISLEGDDSNGTDGLQQTFDMILQSWQWNI